MIPKRANNCQYARFKALMLSFLSWHTKSKRLKNLLQTIRTFARKSTPRGAKTLCTPTQITLDTCPADCTNFSQQSTSYSSQKAVRQGLKQHTRAEESTKILSHRCCV